MRLFRELLYPSTVPFALVFLAIPICGVSNIISFTVPYPVWLAR